MFPGLIIKCTTLHLFTKLVTKKLKNSSMVSDHNCYFEGFFGDEHYETISKFNHKNRNW
jgi:hypothetical protein